MKKQDIYDRITNRIKEKLENGVLPWRKSWKVGIPMNYLTKRPYKGINFLSLCTNDYGSPYYLTFLQCKEKSGKIVKGASGSLIVYWNIKERITEYNNEDDTKIKQFPFIRYSYVFNLSETTLNCKNTTKPLMIECEEIISNIGAKPDIRHNIHQCFYNPAQDYISLPLIDDFDSAAEYYSSLFHELVHWTGHPDRLNRLQGKNDKSVRNVEELVAEIGSAYLCGICGIEPSILDNHASYIDSWLGEYKSNKLLFIQAALKAKKAVSFILDAKIIPS